MITVLQWLLPLQLWAAGPVYIRDSHCVANHTPDFDDLRKIGAIVP
jgi:hypothetical protein